MPQSFSIKKILEERCKPHTYDTPKKYEFTLKKLLLQKASTTSENIAESADLTRIILAIMRESNRLGKERAEELGREVFGN